MISRSQALNSALEQAKLFAQATRNPQIICTDQGGKFVALFPGQGEPIARINADGQIELAPDKWTEKRAKMAALKTQQQKLWDLYAAEVGPIDPLEESADQRQFAIDIEAKSEKITGEINAIGEELRKFEPADRYLDAMLQTLSQDDPTVTLDWLWFNEFPDLNPGDYLLSEYSYADLKEAQAEVAERKARRSA